MLIIRQKAVNLSINSSSKSSDKLEKSLWGAESKLTTAKQVWLESNLGNFLS